MQDIDFDEIDRAVNSITSTDFEANTNVQANATPAPVVSTPATSAPVVVTPVEPEAPAPAVAPSPAARRSSGRFMDVVHPSSDMRPSSIGSRPSVPSFQREDVAERKEVADRPEPTLAAAPSAAFHWPDPIDAAVPTPAPMPDWIEEVEPSVVEPAATVTEEPPIVPELEDEDEDEGASPLESPFLTDAKVEKRPLGAFSGADADLPLLEDPIPFSTNVAPQPEPVVVAEAEVEEPAHEEHEETPQELHPDLLALEGHDQEDQAVDQDEDNSDELLLAATNPPDPEPATVAEDVPTGPTSITQQYKEQPSTASGPSGSIFDTEAYHQPLTHPPKKRSKVLIIVWIIALILIGGGIGAGIYFVVLPMLG